MPKKLSFSLMSVTDADNSFDLSVMAKIFKNHF
jgi:hypothetical protein